MRGAKTFALDVALPGWQVDDVGPDNLVAVDGFSGGGASPCSIPLLQPSAGQFEIRIRAHQPIPPNARSLAISLPQPLDGAPQSAVVVVLPADNVELIPDNKAILGLVRQQIAAPLDLPARQQEPLVYRGEPGKAVFAADIRRHAQRIRVDAITQLDVDEQGGRIEEKLSYSIAYAPVDHLLLDVPRSLAGSNRLELFAQDRRVAAVALPENADDPARPVRMRVALPKASIGLCRLTVRYRTPLEKLASAKRTVLSVPLILPAEGELSSDKLIVHTAPGLCADVLPGSWTVDNAAAGRQSAAHNLELTAAKPSLQADLDVQWEDEGAAIVERAWVQTWLTASARQDRAVFQFTSGRKELEVSIPAGVAPIRSACGWTASGRRRPRLKTAS